MIRVKLGPGRDEIEIVIDGACDHAAAVREVFNRLIELVYALRGGLSADETDALTERLKGQGERLKGVAADPEGSPAAGPQPAQ